MSKLLSLIFLLFTFLTSKEQTTPQTFKLSDTTFLEGTIFRDYTIFWDLDRTTLRPESKVSLDSFAVFLNKHPELIIEIGLHTDGRNDDMSSFNLGPSRVKSIVDYLASKGISAQRLSGVYYGSKNLIFSLKEIDSIKTAEDKERAYQTNRRVEYKIMSK